MWCCTAPITFEAKSSTTLAVKAVTMTGSLTFDSRVVKHIIRGSKHIHEDDSSAYPREGHIQAVDRHGRLPGRLAVLEASEVGLQAVRRGGEVGHALLEAAAQTGAGAGDVRAAGADAVAAMDVRVVEVVFVFGEALEQKELLTPSLRLR